MVKDVHNPPTNRQLYTVEYAYDHQGRMVWKTVSTNSAVISTRTLLWDNYNIIAETIHSTVPSFQSSTNLYVWGLDLSEQSGAGLPRHSAPGASAGGVGGLLAEVRDGAFYTAAYDANGNVSEYLSAEGSLVAHYEYDPFGNTVVQSGVMADSFTHRFSTKPWCDITGLSEYLFRKYSPGMGRWISRDPIGEQGGENLYIIVGNDSIQKCDYFGLDWVNPNPNWPPVTPAPKLPKGATGATIAAALLAAIQQAAQDAMALCDGPCIKSSVCLSCCDKLTNTALAAALGVAVFGNVECLKMGNPWAIALCIGSVDYVYKATGDSILESQRKCSSGCHDNPL